MAKVNKYYQYLFICEQQVPARDRDLAMMINTNCLMPLMAKQADSTDKVNPNTPLALEQALAVNLPPLGAKIAISQLGLNEVGAMAVLHNRALEIPIIPRLVTAMATMDKFGPSIKGFKDQREACLAALTKMEEDSTLETKVWWFSSLLAGWVGKPELTSLATTYTNFYHHLSSDVNLNLSNEDRICVLETDDSLAITIGFQHASTVIVFNPTYPRSFDNPQMGTYSRVLINRFSPAVKIDFPKILAELNQKEASRSKDQFHWHGGENHICSPEGRASVLTKDEVMAIVKNNLI